MESLADIQIQILKFDMRKVGLKPPPLTADEEGELIALKVMRNVMVDSERGARINLQTERK